jgi:hypothetical protein
LIVLLTVALWFVLLSVVTSVDSVGIRFLLGSCEVEVERINGVISEATKIPAISNNISMATILLCLPFIQTLLVFKVIAYGETDISFGANIVSIADVNWGILVVFKVRGPFLNALIISAIILLILRSIMFLG